MTRAERRQIERAKARDNTTYTLTASELQDMRINAFNEAKAELTKEYDARWNKYVKEYEARLEKYGKVGCNRALIYVIGLSVDILTKKFGFTKKKNAKYFEELKDQYNACPNFMDMLNAIDDYAGYDITPTLDEIYFEDELKELMEC